MSPTLRDRCVCDHRYDPNNMISEQAHQALAALCEQHPDGNIPASGALIRQLKQQFGGDAIHQWIAVAMLQPKARRKFGEGIWWATERSLQQATPSQVAKIKSNWLLDSAGPECRIVDACCGMGGDTLELARAARDRRWKSPVLAVDQDETLLHMLEQNAAQSGLSDWVRPLQQDVQSVPLDDRCVLHIDPDRRATPGGRTVHPEAYSPRWDEFVPIAVQARSAAIKFAPAARLQPLIDETESLQQCPMHRSWFSWRGDVREQTLWIGSVVQTAGLADSSVSAVVVSGDGHFRHFVPSESESVAENAVPSIASIGEGDWMVDPDAAIRAAGLTTAFAHRIGAGLLHRASGFLCVQDAARDIAGHLAGFAIHGRVIWAGTADDRKLRKLLRQNDWFPQAIKVRGTDHNPSSLQKRYRECGQTPITLWIGRQGKRVFAAATEVL
ncbi:SAM-dependent methyltransferase [Crateriforma conspicua]|uniref:Methyltransferase domain protein n=1 Tax=Crateriforma conspicua TaxID=2527996 RepID=A0A5C5YF84_9PLAN|nr:class I SAM-dependent methyltransferase [Crateriforma conspicua]TWT71932.1 Methyltransferase domain protein [Crateriforma conspicua]